jgi:hypothetical protein
MSQDQNDRSRVMHISQISQAEARFNRIIAQYGTHLREAIARVCPRDLRIRVGDSIHPARVLK